MQEEERRGLCRLWVVQRWRGAEPVGELCRLQNLHWPPLLAREVTFPHKQGRGYPCAFAACLLEEGTRDHGYSSVFCHHVNHTLGFRSKVYLQKAGPVLPGRTDLFVRYRQHGPLTQDTFHCYCLVAKSCPTLWLHGLWPAGLLFPWHFPGKNTRVGCHFFLQGIFLTQGSNLCLLH